MLTILLNPKIGTFYLSVIPGLLSTGTSSAVFGFTMGCIQACLGLLFLSAVSSADEVFRRGLPSTTGRVEVTPFGPRRLSPTGRAL